MADTERNPAWRRHKRPQSMAAQQFSAALDNLFRMDDGIDTIVQTVEEKRRSVFKQNQELEELQAKIRAAEAKLKAAGSEDGSAPSSPSHSPVRSAAKEIFSTMETAKIPEEPEAEKMEAKTSSSTLSNDFVVVERPRPPRPVARTRLRKPEVVEESSEEEEDSSEAAEDNDEEDDDEEEEDEDSSEETDSGSEESDES